LSEFYYGGQAVIEGVMMRGQKRVAVAVRNPEGEIIIHEEPLPPKIYQSKVARTPFVRGLVLLWDALVLGTRALMWSADVALEEENDEEEEGQTVGFSGPVAWVTIAFSLAFGVGLFILLPTAVSYLLENWLNLPKLTSSFLEGVFRLRLFVGYIAAIGMMPDVKRVFGYHGAEHKSIHAFENGNSLDADGARPFTTLHPRCGTSFLFFVMLISIVVFSFLGRPETIADRLERLAFVPLIGGLAYEAIKLSGKFAKSWLIKPFIFPGLMMQKITTSEPADDQLTVGMAALRAVLTPEADDFTERTFYDIPGGTGNEEEGAPA